MTIDDDFKYKELHGVDVGGEDWQAYRSMQISNNISGESPDWMKSPFDANRRFFEELGPPSPKPDDGRPAAGSETEFLGKPKAVKRSGHVHAETGKVFNRSIVSAKAPDFFKTPFENNRAYFEKEWKGQVQDFDAKRNTDARRDPATRKDRPAGVHSEWRRGNWILDADNHGRAQNMVVQQTGRICNSSIVSAAVPAWMKSPFETNRAYFEAKGVAQKMKPCGVRAHEGVFTQTFGDCAGRGKNRQCEDTGYVWNGSITSPDAPNFMKSPFESNRGYFEETGTAQKLKMRPRANRLNTAGITSRERVHVEHVLAQGAGMQRPKSAPTLAGKSQSSRTSGAASSGRRGGGAGGHGHGHGHGQGGRSHRSTRPAVAASGGARGGGGGTRGSRTHR